MASSPDDYLSFKEYPMMQDDLSARINVNSPEKKNVQSEVEAEPAQRKTASLFSIEFYQQFFNVDTMDVVQRLVFSMIPKRAPAGYLKSHLGLNPDLYGPFWVTMTLIFTIAISGNLANYLQHTKDFHWHYNFHLVSVASTCIIMYVCMMPAIIWGVLKWSVNLEDESNVDLEGGPYIPSLLSLVCLYGYSLAVYIPVSVLWTIQFSPLQWLLVMTGAFLSGSVLIHNLMPCLKLSKYSFFLTIGIGAAHFLLAAGFMLYFFHVPTGADVKEKLVETVTQAVKQAQHVISNNSAGH
jgi:hypothetical protein